MNNELRIEILENKINSLEAQFKWFTKTYID